MPEGGIGLLVWTLESGIESREILTERQAQLGKLGVGGLVIQESQGEMSESL